MTSHEHPSRELRPASLARFDSHRASFSSCNGSVLLSQSVCDQRQFNKFGHRNLRLPPEVSIHAVIRFQQRNFRSCNESVAIRSIQRLWFDSDPSTARFERGVERRLCDGWVLLRRLHNNEIATLYTDRERISYDAL